MIVFAIDRFVTNVTVSVIAVKIAVCMNHLSLIVTDCKLRFNHPAGLAEVAVFAVEVNRDCVIYSHKLNVHLWFCLLLFHLLPDCSFRFPSCSCR